MRRQRVVLVINSLQVGGAEGQVVTLAAGLDRSRFDVRVLVFEDGPLRGDLERLCLPLTVLRLPVPRLTAWHHPGEALRLFRVVAALAGYFRAVRPDIVHAYLAAASFASSLAVRTTRRTAFIAARRQLGELKGQRRLARSLDNVVNTLAQRVTCNSEAVKRDILAHERINPAKLRVIYNGIDTTPFQDAVDVAAQRHRLGLPSKVPLIGCVANLSPIKGHADLIHALPMIRRAVPGASLALVGQDRGSQGDLEALAGACGVREAVHFLGLRRDLPRMLPIFDVQAQCSHTEAFSNAILEGGAAGVPLVVSAVGGNVEQVVSGESGLVVPPGSAEAIAAAITRLLLDRPLARQLAAAMRQRVEERFSLRAMLRASEQLYLECAS